MTNKNDLATIITDNLKEQGFELGEPDRYQRITVTSPTGAEFTIAIAGTTVGKANSFQEAVYSFLDENPKGKLAEIAEALGCTAATALRYRKAWRAEQPEQDEAEALAARVLGLQSKTKADLVVQALNANLFPTATAAKAQSKAQLVEALAQ